MQLESLIRVLAGTQVLGSLSLAHWDKSTWPAYGPVRRRETN